MYTRRSMAGTFHRALAALRPGRGPPALDGFVDSLVQSFENCRGGLGDEAIRAGQVEAYFRARYEPERSRLADVLRLENPLLDDAGRAALFERIDRLMVEVVIPAYVRPAGAYTVRERNDFYHAPPRLHALERVALAALGALLGALAVRAPFIPLWSKEWVLPFFVGGLVWPELRRVFQIRRYERELNRLVGKADAEIGRIDVSYLLHPSPEGTARTKEGSEAWSRSQADRRQPVR